MKGAVSDSDIQWMIDKLCGIGGSSVAAAESAAAMLESLRDERRRSPSYDALLIISQSVAAALERAGVEECDDPGDAIDALAKDAARYAIARRMSPQQWADARELNHRTGKPFDEIIDDLAPFFDAAMAGREG